MATSVYVTSPVMVGGGFRRISAGANYGLALKDNGSLWAWGGNSEGQLGDGSTTSRLTPVLVGTGFSAIAAGTVHALGLKSDGTLWAWGNNSVGTLGNGSFVGATTPQLVINETVTGILDLDPTVPNNIPAGAIPKIILEARKKGDLTSLVLGANVYFGAADVGQTAGQSGGFAESSAYKVYVAAIVPGGISGLSAGIYLLDANVGWSYHAGGPLPAYMSNVTLDATKHYFVSILEYVDLTGLNGARILVGYGLDDQEMLAEKRYSEVYVVRP